MLIDARTVAADSVVRGDLCIIGAGAAGISIAWALRDHPVRVVLLESGSFWPSAATQALYRGRNIGRGYFPLDGCRVRTFGGSTQRWGGWCRSLDPSDFEPRPWLPGSGWPMKRDDLGCYYRQAREMCQLAVTEGEIDHGPPLPYRPRLAGTHPALATVVYQFSPPTRFGPTYRDGLERAKNIDGYLSANVVELLGGEHGGPVTGARVSTLAGRTFRVEATTFVLATGGVENARLLLASNGTRPGGLGNENDLVGRFFMEHLHVRLGCFVPTRPDANLSFYTQGRRSVRRPLGGLTVAPAARPAHGVYGFSAVFFTPRHRTVAKVLQHQAQRHDQWALHGVSIAQGGAMGFGMRVLDKLARDAQEASARLNFAVPQPAADRIYEIMGRGEQSPNRDSRVTIGRDRDRLGMPVCELDWRVRRADLTNIRTQPGNDRRRACGDRRGASAPADRPGHGVGATDRRQLAPHGHDAHACRSARGRGRRRLPRALGSQSLHRGQLGVPDRRLRQPHAHDRRAGPAAGGPSRRPGHGRASALTRS